MTSLFDSPVSTRLSEMLSQADRTEVSIGWLMEQLGPRSFGLTMLAMGLFGLVPGLSTIVGALVAWPALQMIGGREVASLPRIVRQKTVQVEKLARISRAVSPRLARIERLIRPRWSQAIRTTKTLTGVVVLLLGVSMVLPVPFGHLFPCLAIIILALAYLEGDGVTVLVGLLTALASLAITAAAVWGTVATILFLENRETWEPKPETSMSWPRVRLGEVPTGPGGRCGGYLGQDRRPDEFGQLL
jgi:hypothetical protein